MISLNTFRTKLAAMIIDIQVTDKATSITNAEIVERHYVLYLVLSLSLIFDKLKEEFT